MRSAKGFSLVEILLGIGIASAIATGAYIIYKPTSATANAKAEQHRIESLSRSISSSFGATGDFSGLSSSEVLKMGLADKELLKDGKLKSNWNEGIEVAPYEVKAPNDAFKIQYQQVSSDVCLKLIPAVSEKAYAVSVNGNSVFDAEHTYIPGKVAQQCSSKANNVIDLVFYEGFAKGSYVATPLELPANPNNPQNPNPASPITDPGNAKDGEGATSPGTVTPNPIGPSIPTPPPITPPAAVTPPTGGGSTNPPIVAPPVVTPPASSCVPRSETSQAGECPAGTWGWVYKKQDFTCPEAWGTPVSSGWKNTGSNCQACQSNYAETNYQWVGVSQGCSAGFSGSITYQKQQQQSRTISFSCPAGTTSAPGASIGGWSGWSDTGATQNYSNTCVQDKPAGCLVETENSTGVVDGSDSFHSISYTIKGQSNSCYASWRDTKDSGYCVSRTISLQQFFEYAQNGGLNIGDNYYESGGSGWESSQRAPWSYNTQAFEFVVRQGNEARCMW